MGFTLEELLQLAELLRSGKDKGIALVFGSSVKSLFGMNVRNPNDIDVCYISTDYKYAEELFRAGVSLDIYPPLQIHYFSLEQLEYVRGIIRKYSPIIYKPLLFLKDIPTNYIGYTLLANLLEGECYILDKRRINKVKDGSRKGIHIVVKGIKEWLSLRKAISPCSYQYALSET